MASPEMIGKYRIERELGRGAMGVVYAGFDPVIERRVAIKTIRLDLLDSGERDEVMQRFKREAQAAGRLNHPNIVAVYEYGEIEGQAYIAMELIDGQELKSMLDSHQRFDAAGVGKLMEQLLDALDFSHRGGVVHRDIKPANIFVLADGRIKVTDFGVARVASSNLTQTGSVLGTPSYMSPEQFMGLPVDGRSDLFSAGVLLYQLLTGEKPFTGSAVTTIMHKVLNEVPPSPSALNFQLPKALDAVVSKALSKRPEERFQTGREFADALHAAFARTTAADIAEATMLHTAAAGDATVVHPVTPPRPAAVASPPPMPAAAVVPPVLPPQAVPPALATPQPTPPPARPVAPPPLRPAAIPPPARKSSAGLLIGAAFAVVVIAGGAAFYFLRGGEAKPDAAPVASTGAPPSLPTKGSEPPSPPPRSSAFVVQAEAIFDPGEAGAKADPNLVKAALNEESKRQMIEKALGFFVADDSLRRNYTWLKDKFLSRGDEFVTDVAAQEAPWMGKDGLMHMKTQGVVRMREVQRSLNQLTREERVDLIRKKGDPKIAVAISVADAERASGVAPQRSAVAENTLKEKISQFGYRVWSEAPDKKGADFTILGEVKFKKLSHKLEASGLVITKHVITSWTVKCVDVATGEEIYYNTQLPDSQSWADEDRAILAIGTLIGDQFSQSFFAQHVRPEALKMGLSLEGVSDGKLRGAVLRELDGLPQISTAKLDGSAFTIEMSPGEGSPASYLTTTVSQALNRKMGQECFQPSVTAGTLVSLRLAAPCTEAKAIELLETRPPAAFYMAPEQRRDAVIRSRDVRAKIGA